jgi:FAD:protein FMN transferase
VMLLDRGAAGMCVNVGGDLRVDGESPDSAGWRVGVEECAADEGPQVLALHHGAIATSSRRRRTWSRGSRSMHHLIDPETGRPTASDVTVATVVTDQAWRAEVLAKAMLIAGTGRAPSMLDDDAFGMLVDDCAARHHLPGVERFLA